MVCMAPFEIAGRIDTTIQVSVGGSSSNAIKVPVNQSAAQILAIANQDSTQNSSSQPAAPGTVVTVYVTGMGQTSPSVDGQIGTGTGTFVTTVPVTIDENFQNPVIPLYAGPAPGLISGFGQVNVVVPQLSAGKHDVEIWYPGQDSLLIGTLFDSIFLFVGQ